MPRAGKIAFQKLEMAVLKMRLFRELVCRSGRAKLVVCHWQFAGIKIIADSAVPVPVTRGLQSVATQCYQIRRHIS
jgi:hypothetical protein